MSSINFGTLSLTSGSKIVTGTNTFFADNIVDGSVFVIDQMVYLIDTVDSQTQVTLTLPWPGTTDDGIEYEAYLTSDYSKATFAKVVELIDTFGPLRVSAEAFQDLINSRADDAEAAKVAAQAAQAAAEDGADAAAASAAAALADKNTTTTLKGDVLTLKGDVITLKNATDTNKTDTDAAKAAALAAQAAAEAALASTLSAFDSFDDRYLGAKSSPPIVDNDGNALVAGTIYYRTTATQGMYVWTGSAWAAAYVDGALYLPLAGGTMTGALTLSADPTSALHAATKQYVDNGLSLKLNTTTAASTYLPLAGGTVSGNLGVGVTAGAKLHAKSASEILRLETTTARGGGNGFMSFYDPTGRKGYFGYGGGNDDMYLSNEMNGSMLFITNASERMRVNSTGLGIGTTSPSTKLHVLDGAIFNQTSAGTPYFFFGNADGATDLKYSYMGGGSGGYITFGKASDALAPSAEWARFDGSGRLGIGTSNPGYKLDVAADARVMGNFYVQPSTTTANAFTRYINTGGTAFVGLDNSAGGLGGPYSLNLWHSGAYPIVFGTNNSERMRLDASGNLGIGTTGPRAALHAAGGVLAVASPVLGAATNSAFIVSNSAAAYGLSVVPSGDGSVHLQAQRFDGTATAYPLLLNSAGGNIGLCGSGTVSISGYNTVTLNGDTNGSVFDLTQGGGMKLRFVASSVGAAIETAASIPLYFTPGGNQRMNLTTGGNLTMTPAVTGAVTTPAYIALGNDYSTTALAENCKIFLYNTGGVDKYGFGVGSNADLQYHAGGASNTLGRHVWYSGNSEKMRLTQGGYLGIGLASPGSKLHVNSDTSIETFAAAGNPVGQTRIGVAADGTSQVRAYASMPLVFAHDNLGGTVTERMRISTGGVVTIGAANPVGSGFLKVIADPAQSYYTICASTTNSSMYALQCVVQGSQVGTITCTTTATAYNTSSDRKLKKNIADADVDTGELIDAIQIRKFDWKADNQHQRLGVIAQELIEVTPEAVTVPLDEENEFATWSVDYSKLVPMLIKEIQNLRGRVAGLEDGL